MTPIPPVDDLLHRTMIHGDPNHFIEACFRDPQGNPMRQALMHIELQQFLSMHRQALVELPRDHGKSTQVCARIIWELGHDPSLRIKIVCATEGLAAERARFLRQAIADNPSVRRYFPRLLPRDPWGFDRFTVMRPAEAIGPSVASFGIGGGSTGTRADLLVCDDIVDVKSVSSVAHRERIKNAFRENLMNLLEPGGRFWGLCTPWHRDDLNAELKKNPKYALFRRAIGEGCEPLWPEHWSREALAARREAIGPLAFARGYHLIPVADAEMPIRAEWIRFWQTPLPPDRCVLAVDPAVSMQQKADRSALAVLHRCGHEIRLVDMLALRTNAPHLIDVIDELDRIWNPEVILFEANGPFQGIADLMVRQAAFGGKIRTITQSMSKLARATLLSIPIRNGQVRLKGTNECTVDASQQEAFDELTTFPVAEHDDLVDAIGMGVRYLQDRREPRVF